MVSGINNIQQSTFQPKSYQRQVITTYTPEPINSFDIEDQAIISSQAKLLNELDKFNSGEGDPLNLALAGITAKTTVKAEANVIKAKSDIMDTILKTVE